MQDIVVLLGILITFFTLFRQGSQNLCISGILTIKDNSKGSQALREGSGRGTNKQYTDFWITPVMSGFNTVTLTLRFI